MGLYPWKALTAKVARTDAIAAGADDVSWNNSCGATPEAVWMLLPTKTILALYSIVGLR